MKKIFILADDMTGTLDTAVKFSKAGMSTAVSFDEEKVFSLVSKYDVVAFNMESRHIKPEEAYLKAYDASKKACLNGADIIFKKTDSAMRGNTGAEIKGAMEGLGVAEAHFAGAFPEKERIVKNGELYINGLPAEKSPFAADPTDPITTSNVSDIIKSTCPNTDGINIYDAVSNSDLDKICKGLIKNERLCIAGCAGLAESLANILAQNTLKSQPNIANKNERILIVSGSVNSITQSQIKFAEDMGICTHIIDFSKAAFSNNYIENADKIEYALNNEGIAVVATSDGIAKTGKTNLDSKKIIDILCSYVKFLDGKKAFDAVAVFGGDTLTGILNVLNIKELSLLDEIESGTVVLDSPNLRIITKSGGFGNEDIISRIHLYLKGIKYDS